MNQLVSILSKTFFTGMLCLSGLSSYAQSIQEETQQAMACFLNSTTHQMVSCGEVKLDSTRISTKQKTIVLYANLNLSYFPFREESVQRIYREVRQLLPPSYRKYKLLIYTDNQLIESLIPLACRERPNKRLKTFHNKVTRPLVTRISEPYQAPEGLQNRHIALWQSHGYYYEAKLARWEWQRARIFQTVEDLYTQSYVLPFLVPMLENAGANVLLPRERDTQTHEIIVDNDTPTTQQSVYQELAGRQAWTTGGEPGFANLKATYQGFENPFREGSYRQTATIKRGSESWVQWEANLPESGTYAVYVAYKTVENSTDDALYTVYHQGGTSQFKVNQRMGGGTWIYLGHFDFKNETNGCRVRLSNRSREAGQVVTADAVKIGGGYGNIARCVSPKGYTPNVKSSEQGATAKAEVPTITYPSETSGYPRFCEAARYWMQWAGIPDSVYSESKGQNDYTDDYKSRGYWVNYLAGGSSANSQDNGLHIPIDMAFAFHSDAGTTYGDTIIGTLGIFETQSDEGLLGDKKSSRYASRDLTDLIQSSIVQDVRKLYDPQWTRRGMWNKSYFEARVPRVPTMLLELLSHQNFADMRYGLDPRFRFTVSRAIYKGMLKFIASQYKTNYVVQPLPVDHMALCFIADREVELTWQAVTDSLEPTAQAEQYLVYQRIGEGAFDQGTVVQAPRFRCSIPADQVCSFKVCALNKGGKSFPSEVLSIGLSSQSKGTVMVVNSFDRISAPADFTADADTLAGFLDELDHGVPYLNDISYIGSQKEFRQQIPWMDDDASGFGDSYGTHETQVVAGNSFDYPSVHGAAILKAGYSFASCSNEVVENNQVSLTDYKNVDLILGKSCQTKMGPGGLKPMAFKTFNSRMQKAITNYCQAGGALLVSGAYVGTDLWDNRWAKPQQTDLDFATKVLKYKWRVGRAAQTGQVKSVISPLMPYHGKYCYYNELNSTSYVVESPDAIEPAESGAYTVLRYGENNLSAGIAYQGTYKTCVFGFPFEAIRTPEQRGQLMQAILTFFNHPSN